MNKVKLLLKTALLTAGILVLSGCAMGAQRSKDECLQEFFSNALASNWNSMYKQIHPDNPSYNNYKSGGLIFEAIYGGFTKYDIISTNGDTYKVNVITDVSNTETFKFKREDDDIFSNGYWSIITFTNNGTTY